MNEQIDYLGRMMVIWNFIETWIQRNAPDLMTNLVPGTTQQHVQAVETQLNITLPEDVKASWQLHNGTINGFCGGGSLFSDEISFA